MVRFFAALCAASLGVARVSGQGDPFGGDGDGYCSEWTVPAGSGYTVEGQLQVSPGGDFTRFEGKLIVKKGGALNTTDTFIGTMTQGTECLDTRTPIGGGSWIDDATNLPATFTIPVTSDTTDGVRSFDERSTYQVAVNGTANSFMIYSNTGWPVGCCVMHSWGAYLSQSPAPCSEVPCKTFTPADSEKKWFVATMVIIFVMVLPAMAAGVCLLMYRNRPDMIDVEEKEQPLVKTPAPSPMKVSPAPPPRPEPTQSPPVVTETHVAPPPAPVVATEPVVAEAVESSPLVAQAKEEAAEIAAGVAQPEGAEAAQAAMEADIAGDLAAEL